MESATQLYHRYLNGEEACLTLLMEQFGDALTFYIFGYLQNAQDAEDIMIEAFSYLVVKRPRIQDGAFKAYLYKIARNMALRTKEKKRKEFSFVLEDLQHLPDEKTLVDAIIATQEKSQVLHMCMEQLSPDYREALYLVYFEGLSHKEAAVVMKKREKQVADLVYRGKKSLKFKLEKAGITNA